MFDGVCVEWKVKCVVGFEKNIARFVEYVEIYGSSYVFVRCDKKFY